MNLKLWRMPSQAQQTQRTALQNEAAAKHGFFSIESLGGGPCWSCDSCVLQAAFLCLCLLIWRSVPAERQRNTHQRPREIDTERVSECKEISNGRHV